MTKKTSKFGLLITSALALSVTACDTVSQTIVKTPASRYATAKRLASPAWMVERQIHTDPFNLTAFERMHKRGAPANVYIEGDGLAWMSRQSISLDPTPVNPTGLHLASFDKSENVAYLARPCQYTKMSSGKPCSSAYWTGRRFSPEVIRATSEALDNMKKRYGITSFNLIGFSGGGTLAAILAAERTDVDSLRSVAGNMDHKAHSRVHDVSYLDGSKNPPDYARTLQAVPQVHFIGGQDEIVPPAVLHSYLDALPTKRCVTTQMIQEAEHNKGWTDKWPQLLKIEPSCRKSSYTPR